MENKNLKLDWGSESNLNKPIYTLTVREFIDLVETFVPDPINQSPPVKNDDYADRYIRGTQELAKYLKISKSKAAQFKKKGTFKCQQIGRLIYFDKRNVDETISELSEGKQKSRRKAI